MVVPLTSFKNDDIREITSVTRYLSIHGPNREDASGLLESQRKATVEAQKTTRCTRPQEKNGSNQSFDFIKDFKSSVKSSCD